MNIDQTMEGEKNNSVRVLLIDHKPEEARRIQQLLSRLSTDQLIHLTHVEKLRSGLRHLSEQGTDVVLVSLALPESQGLGAFIRVRSKNPLLPIIVLTNLENEELALEAVHKGAQDYWLLERDGGVKLTRMVHYAMARKRSEYVMRESEHRLKKQSEVLNQLAKSKHFSTGSVEGALEEITKAALETLRVDRVSVWLLDHNDEALRCAALVQKENGLIASGDRLEVASISNYLASLVQERCIAVRNIYVDERTRDLAQSAFSHSGVQAVLDAPIRVRGRMVGYLCHSQIGRSREWAVDEQIFAASLADLAALAMETQEAKRLEDELEHLSAHDPLTGLPNRPLFLDQLSRAIVVARQNQLLVGVLFLGLDHFKRVNDTLGHAGGDKLLRAAAERLKSGLHPSDLVGRIGGDAFSVLLSSIQNTKDAADAAHRIAQTFKAPFLIEGQEFFVSWSVGISFFPVDGRDATTLLKNADTAMFRAKQQGRNNYQFYSPTMNAKALERLVLENSLRHALERSEFRVYYQPIVDLKTGEITGAEALLRWEHPNLGLISPGEFIPLAEETGLIIPIGEWVLKTACLQNQSWRAKGYDGIRVTVNLSARQFQHEDLAAVVKETLKEASLPPSALELELTESLIMHSAERSASLLRDLTTMGVKLSIDDFGTGYSSLNYLKRFPIHTLKIDHSFVRDISTDPDDAAIVKAIISMAHSLKIEVVAESVETQEQLEFLKASQCDKIQGYIFSRPVPSEAFERLLTHKKSK